MRLEDKKIAIVATHGFEKSELFEPLNALKEEGAQVHVIAPESGFIKSWDQKDWGESILVDMTLANAAPSDYDSLVLPGGVMNPDMLRTNKDAIQFIRAFFQEGKPVAAICHAPWLLIDAGVLQNRKATSYKSIKQDIINAGANWLDQEVVVDQGMVTSRNPDDLPAFIQKIVEETMEGKHKGQSLNA
ncbi:type 1 glutamine amidotransferase domain-containing protein [Flagellimonas abyssi]|uniref:Type 1 glutamine amidotransferase n=1 Tax=Flagellimonas abyssi TaxID=2864871 RepID=A0ABS7EU54_9FLAO|nr:type 1 glutamine amidotransferase domain-containing protein [Allomuricauda abyssi]MBW8201148.1 type 1 glutamine amidotransferase [Allomuricauda abyssi]